MKKNNYFVNVLSNHFCHQVKKQYGNQGCSSKRNLIPRGECFNKVINLAFKYGGKNEKE